TVGLGAIQRQVGLHQQPVRLAGVGRRNRNAYAGVGNELVAETFEGIADRFVNSGDKIGYVRRILNAGLNDRKFVAAEPRDQISLADAPAQAQGDAFQELIADRVTQRVVDALEFVDVDVKQCDLFAILNLAELLLEPILEERAIG